FQSAKELSEALAASFGLSVSGTTGGAAFARATPAPTTPAPAITPPPPPMTPPPATIPDAPREQTMSPASRTYGAQDASRKRTPGVLMAAGALLTAGIVAGGVILALKVRSSEVNAVTDPTASPSASATAGPPPSSTATATPTDAPVVTAVELTSAAPQASA